MSIADLWRRLRGRGRLDPHGAEQSLAPRAIDVRISRVLFEQLCAHVEDFSRGEEAAFLICSIAQLADRDVLLARELIPVPESAITRGSEGSVLAWSARFNSQVLERAVALGATAVLVHSHGSPDPRFSSDDRRRERPLFGTFSRILVPLPAGTMLLGKGDATASFWLDGANDRPFRRLVIVGESIETWEPPGDAAPPPVSYRQRLDRQSLAIGTASERKLADAKVAVVGVSGGGSHVIQQLAHIGVGTLIPIDAETVDETNLGRLVGAVQGDIDTTQKIDVARRVAGGIDPAIKVAGVPEQFPSSDTIAALKESDAIVTCLDRLDARAAVGAFARRNLIPHVDIGIQIRTHAERLTIAEGQLIVSIPGMPCMRCWFLTDRVLAREQRERPAGYDKNPDAPGDPQVISMNGTLASEACNCVLDLIAGYSRGRRGAAVWQYDGRSGQLERCELPSRRPDCPACAEEGHGDPRIPPPATTKE
jgi:molybdopterin-synthase adenylyltransferase